MAKQPRDDAGCHVRRLLHEPDRDPERRDWAKLPPDLVAEIADRVLNIDLTEYIRFRAVCKPWRQSTEDPRGLHSRFLPRNWVLLVYYLDHLRYNYGEETREFRLLNVATGATLTNLELPELSGYKAMGYAEGLLVLQNKTTSGIRLLNPLTHAVTDLPDFSSILVEASTTRLHRLHRLRGFGVVDGGPSAAGASSPTVVIFLDDGVVPMLGCIRLGETRWVLVDTSELDVDSGMVKVSFSSVLSLRGRFYMSTSIGDVLTMELLPKPRLVYVIKQTATATGPMTTGPPSMRPFYEFFLAPSSNDNTGMLMVRRNIGEADVFEVDLDAGKLVPTSTVGTDRAVFIGSARALSISTRLFPSAATNAVYFCVGLRPVELLFYVVHLDTGLGEPAHVPYSGLVAGPFSDPCNLDVYLAWCVDYVHI